MAKDYLAIGISDSDDLTVWSQDFRIPDTEIGHTTFRRNRAIQQLEATKNAPKLAIVLIVESGNHFSAPNVIDDFNISEDEESPVGLSLDEIRAKISGFHFSQEALSKGEREILHLAESLLSLIDKSPVGNKAAR